MSYTKKSSRHLNSAFIIKPYDPREVRFLNGNNKLIADIHTDTFNPILPKCEIAILNSWEFYVLKDNKKLFLNYESYHPKIHFAEFNFNKLEDLLNFSDFELEINEELNKSKEKFIKELESTLLTVNTDFQIKHWLNIFLTDLQESITSLNNLELNSIQKIVKTLYTKSYKESIKSIQLKYRDYLPSEENSNLDKILVHSKIDKFLSIETELIRRDYLFKRGKLFWNDQKGFKVRLVNFCRILKNKGYTNEHLRIGKVISFFEDRYNIDTGDQAKPSKFSESDKVIEADFVFIKF